MMIQNEETYVDFIQSWQKKYTAAVSKIPIFNKTLTSQWTQKQKEKFVKVFYHARGHFHDFLWYLGNHASDKRTKDIILQNIKEEFNSSAASHEQMYFDFAKNLNVSIEDEFAEQISYLPFLKEFDKGHLRWLKNHDEDCRFAAFSAYEKLDNIDYVNLLNLAQSIGAVRKGITFFKIHAQAKHFDTTEEYLNQIWEKNSEAVKKAFTFIGDHQIDMWQKLSETI